MRKKETASLGMGVIMVGMPGCGKGTQAKMLKEEFNFKILGTGDLLRKRCQEEPSFEKQYGHIMDSGKLLPDDVVNETLCKHFDSLPVWSRWILDGFPRTISQYQRIRECLLEKRREHPIIILHFSGVLKIVLLGRILSRKVGRKDDNKYSFAIRAKEYTENTPGLMEVFKSDEFLVKMVRATSHIELVSANVLSALNL